MPKQGNRRVKLPECLVLEMFLNISPNCRRTATKFQLTRSASAENKALEYQIPNVVLLTVVHAT